MIAAGAGLPPAGAIGRVAKLAVGVLQLAFVYSIATHVASIVRTPPNSSGFWIMVAWAVWLIPHVANLGLVRERALGSRPRWWTVAAFLVVVAIGWIAFQTIWSPPVALFTVTVAGVVHGYVGLCHLASAMLGFPGCELRATSYLVRRARGESSTFAPCPGVWTPLDRWEARMRHRA